MEGWGGVGWGGTILATVSLLNTRGLFVGDGFTLEWRYYIFDLDSERLPNIHFGYVNISISSRLL